MKILLNKKPAILFAAILFCIASTKAQLPDRLKNLPLFRYRASMLSSLNKPHTLAKLNDIRCSPNAPCLKAQTTLGGSNYDEGHKIIKTRDGGFIVCGQTFSGDGDFNVPPTSNGAAYLAKYNKLAKLEWAKTFGGSGFEVFNDIIQTYDGGYAVTGGTNSNDGDVSGNHGNSDVWVVKFSASGNIEWQKCLGGTGDEFGEAIVQTFYGGYAIASFTNSNDGEVSGNHNTDGNFDGWFIQIGPKGNLLSQHCYGGGDFDGFFAIVPSDFGGFILLGSTNSNNGDVSGNHGGADAWVVKLNAFGKIVWQKTVGGSADELVGTNEITRTTDGNVVINGGSFSTDGDINAKNFFVTFSTKINRATGNIIWSKSYADPGTGSGVGVFATRDGGTVETGYVSPVSDASAFDVLVSKFDKSGNQEWYKILGGSDFDGGVNGYETFNGDLNILCESNSLDGDVKGVHPGNTDEWIIQLGRCGEFEKDDNTPLSMSENKDIISGTFAPLSVYPNPVMNAATISFSLRQSQKVSLQVFDMSGRLINKLAEGAMQPGNHQLIWNATDNHKSAVAAGIYLLKLQTGNNIETKKISVVR